MVFQIPQPGSYTASHWCSVSLEMCGYPEEEEDEDQLPDVVGDTVARDIYILIVILRS